MPQFKVISEYTPSGDQPQAIEKLAEGLENGLRQQVLLWRRRSISALMAASFSMKVSVWGMYASG